MKSEKENKDKFQSFDKDIEALVERIRFSTDIQERKSALSELRKLGLVDELDNAPEIIAEPIKKTPQGKPAKVLRTIIVVVAVLTTFCLIIFCLLLMAL
jgi:hypothetical protein